MGILYVTTFPAPVLPKNFTIDFHGAIRLRTLHTKVFNLANEPEGVYTAVYRSRRTVYIVMSNLAAFLYKRKGHIYRMSENIVAIDGVKYSIEKPRDYTIYDANVVDVRTVRNIVVAKL